jgi:putative ABC transport system ATP-binding protein
MIEARGLKKSLRTGTTSIEILKGINLLVPQGQFVAIMGSSGSGKSTLLGLLAGLDSPSEGQVLVDGVDITHLEEEKLAQVRGRKIGFVFQSYQLIPTLTALENVLLPYELNASDPQSRGPSGGPAGRSIREQGRARALELLESVGLGQRLDHYPVQLSGGEQQRVALARAFVLEPPIVLADEPTGNLDSVNGQHVLELLTTRQRQAGTTLVMVTHDPQIADRADRRIVLRDGLVISDELVAGAALGAPALAGER